MSVKEEALKFVETNLENPHNMYCANCRHFDRGPKRESRICRVLQGKASLLDCPALTAHFYPLQRKTT